jgi:hypothetical protein
MNREIQPYAFEPEFVDGEELINYDVESDHSEDEAPEGDENERLGNTNWCTCGNCVDMNSIVECYCCCESEHVDRKRDELVANHTEMHGDICITTMERFQTLCLDRDVLEIALIQIYNALRKGPVPIPIPNR